jgi:hypothetical protein
LAEWNSPSRGSRSSRVRPFGPPNRHLPCRPIVSTAGLRQGAAFLTRRNLGWSTPRDGLSVVGAVEFRP